MDMIQDQLLPLELWLKTMSENDNLFPHTGHNYFKRYEEIKQYLDNNVYKWIGAATSAEDKGIYTDHGIDHFQAVIRSAGKLLGINSIENTQNKINNINLNPYEVFILLVAILLHDAGNAYGRAGHEKKPLAILEDMGKAICPDNFESIFIGKIAEAHGGKVKDKNGQETKDTIRNSQLNETDTYYSIVFRPRLIAALVRFADEICEDRTRAANFLMSHNILPRKSEIYHSYANAISSVDVDLASKLISIKYELNKNDVLDKKGKDDDEEFLIDEINNRLEKMYCELLYCKAFMYEIVPLTHIRATITIYDKGEVMEDKGFELAEDGYPEGAFSFRSSYPEWSGEDVKNRILDKEGGTK